MSDNLAKGEREAVEAKGGGVWPTRKQKGPQAETYGARRGTGSLRRWQCSRRGRWIPSPRRTRDRGGANPRRETGRSFQRLD
jgi:hypothetical protein